MVDISLVVAVFNVQDKLARCIKSLVCQDYHSYEIVVVNDASTDNSLSVAERLSINNKKIRIVSHSVNSGLSAVRNTGASAAIGEYIWHIDGDDYISDCSAISRIMEYLKVNHASVLRMGYKTLDENGLSKYLPFSGNVISSIQLMSWAGCVRLWSHVFKRSVYSDLAIHSLEGVDIGEDQIFLQQLYRCVPVISTFNEAYYVYDRTGASMMRSDWGFNSFIKDRVYFLSGRGLFSNSAFPSGAAHLLKHRSAHCVDTMIPRAKKSLNDIEFDIYSAAIERDLGGAINNNFMRSGFGSFGEEHFRYLYGSAEFVFHCGAHKTATTSIQSILASTKMDLAMEGVLFFELDELRAELTGNVHLMSNEQIYDAMVKLALPLLFSPIKKVIISDENLIMPGQIRVLGKPYVFAPHKNGYSVDRLKRLLGVIPNTNKSIVFGVRNFADYLVSMYSERCRHYEYVDFEDYSNFVEVADNYSWLHIVQSLELLNVPVVVLKYEGYKDDVSTVASYLAGYDLSDAVISDDKHVRRSGATEQAHAIMSRSADKAHVLFNKLDDYCTGFAKYDPLSDSDRRMLSSTYEMDCTVFRFLDLHAEVAGLVKINRKRSFSSVSSIVGLSQNNVKTLSSDKYPHNLTQSFWKAKRYQNIEGKDDFGYQRLPCYENGLSAMLRVKNEASHIELALSSLVHIVDEIVMVDNGSSDSTVELAIRFSESNPELKNKLKIYNYPFEVSRCGDDHFRTPAMSVHSLAYYYNWCLSKCSFSYVIKWDGDMVMDCRDLSSAKEYYNSIVESKGGYMGGPLGVTLYKGWDGVYYNKPKSEIIKEPRVFHNNSDTMYLKDVLWERLHIPTDARVIASDKPIFYELKDVAVNEFAHWSAGTLAFTTKKIEEFKLFSEVSVFSGQADGRNKLVNLGYEVVLLKPATIGANACDLT